MADISRDKILKVAQKLVGQGRLEGAVKEYEKLIEVDPKDPILLNTVGDLCMSLNRVPVAVSYFKRASQKYIDDGFFGKGLALYRKIHRADPKNLENAEILADLFVKEGILTDAKKLYAEIGQGLLQSNQFSRAYQVYKKQADLTHDDPSLHLKLAGLSIRLNSLDNARDSYVSAADVFSRQKNADEALKAVQQAVEIDPCNLTALKLLFKVSADRKDFAPLIQSMRGALAKNPSSLAFQEMLGQAYVQVGDVANAIPLLGEVSQKDESKTGLMLDLAEAAVRLGDLDSAVAALEKVKDKLLARKESSRLIALLQSVVQKSPSHVPALEHLADAYDSISDNINHINTLDLLSEGLIRNGDFKRAISVLETTLGYDPKNEKFRNNHRLVFQKLYPNEPYTPFSDGEHEADDHAPGKSVFDFDTAELASGQAFHTQKKESDSVIEVELLLSYGLRDKAKSKMYSKIQEDPNDTVFREKLKEALKDEGNLTEAAVVCLELAGVYERQGSKERARAALEEGRSLDPSKTGDPGLTGVLTGRLSIPEEHDIKAEPEKLEYDGGAIDLSDDLSEILVGPFDAEFADFELSTVEVSPSVPAQGDGTPAVGDPPTPPAAETRPSKQPPAQVPAPKMPAVSQGDGISLLLEEVGLDRPSPPFGGRKPLGMSDTEVNIRFEQTLKSVSDLGIGPSFFGGATPAAQGGAAQPKQPLRWSSSQGAIPVPAAAAPIPDSLIENLVLEDLDNPEDATSLLSLLTRKDPKKADLAKPAPPEPVAPPPARVEQPPTKPPEIGIPELEAEIQEIDFYIKLGFNDNARDELVRLNRLYPSHRGIQERLLSLGINASTPEHNQPAAPVSEPPPPQACEAVPAEPQPGTTDSMSVAPPAPRSRFMPTTPDTGQQAGGWAADLQGLGAGAGGEKGGVPATFSTVLMTDSEPGREIREIIREQTREDVGESHVFSDISADEVSIDLFNFLPAEGLSYEMDNFQSSAEARMLPSSIPGSDYRLDSDSEDAVGINLLGNFRDKLEEEEITASLGQKPVVEEPKKPGAETAVTRKQTASTDMQDMFADIVEEANKVFAVNVDDADFETHYDLGIAYKEMGLLDDAVGEFQKAFQSVKDDPRSASFIRACNMLNLCFFEKGIYKSAINWCEKGIQSPGHEHHEYFALKYDMASSYEKLGDLGKAVELFGEIYELDVNYRDVANRIKALRKAVG